MAGNNGGPWGGGGSGGGDDDDDRPRGGRRPGEGQGIPEIEEIMKKGQERLRVLMGGRGGRPNGPQGGGDGPGFQFTRGMFGLGAIALLAIWGFASIYTVRPDERSVELFLGKFSNVGAPGLHLIDDEPARVESRPAVSRLDSHPDRNPTDLEQAGAVHAQRL
jgi:membrane protease subunit HflK